MRSFRHHKGLLIAILCALVGLIAVQVRGLEPVSADTDVTYQKLNLLAEVLEAIQTKYVDVPDDEKLIYGAIKGMVASLDPHSSFLTPGEFKELQIETTGKFSGIGIEITVRDGILTVVSPIEDTPAFKAGLMAGDQIIKVDGKLTKQMSLMDAVKTIRGPKGSKVILTILRKSAKELKEFEIIRDVIPIISVKPTELDQGYAYVRITTFQSGTGRDVQKAIDQMSGPEGKLKGLILDLRNNPGGLLSEAVDVSDVFLNKGLIVYTEGRYSGQNMKFFAHPLAKPVDFPVVVLVNQGSASASEIVAGALKDHKRAVIMGTKTFGKGSVQTILPFADQSGMRLTTARYFTPSGVSIQAKGIVPDVVVEFIPPPKEEAKNRKPMRESDLAGHMTNGQQGEQAKKPDKYSKARDMLKRDNQLREAFSLLKGWNVFSATAPQSAANPG